MANHQVKVSLSSGDHKALATFALADGEPLGIMIRRVVFTFIRLREVGTKTPHLDLLGAPGQDERQSAPCKVKVGFPSADLDRVDRVAIDCGLGRGSFIRAVLARYIRLRLASEAGRQANR